jgi:hypothetical protein
MSKVIIAALVSATKAVKELPPAPSFDITKAIAYFRDVEGQSEPAAKVSASARKAKFDAEHGDGESIALQTVFNCLAEGVTDGLEGMSPIMSRLATAARAAGKVNVTAAQWSAALDGKPEEPAHKELLEKARTLRGEGVAWSEIGERLKLSEATRQQLYIVCKALPEAVRVKVWGFYPAVK